MIGDSSDYNPQIGLRMGLENSGSRLPLAAFTYFAPGLTSCQSPVSFVAVCQQCVCVRVII